MLDDRIAGSCAAGQSADGVVRAPVTPRRPVLIVVHQAHSNPGHVGHWFRRHGYGVELCRHFDGAPLPRSLAGYCGAIIMGSPQSANDAHDYIHREIDWIGVALREERPFLGICLGAQMLAHHLGARVDHCRHGTVEIGYHRVFPTTAGGQPLAGLPPYVYQWHREGFEIPKGARLLAGSNGPYPHQALGFGPAAIGVQFHPEITYSHINRWTGSNPVRLLMRGAQSRPEQLQRHLAHVADVQSWLDGFLHRWVRSGLARE